MDEMKMSSQEQKYQKGHLPFRSVHAKKAPPRVGATVLARDAKLCPMPKIPVTISAASAIIIA